MWLRAELLVCPGTVVCTDATVAVRCKSVALDYVPQLTGDISGKCAFALLQPALQVRCSASQRSEVRDVIEIFRASIVDVSQSTLTLEVQGKDDKMKALCDLLEPYGAGLLLSWGWGCCCC